MKILQSARHCRAGTSSRASTPSSITASAYTTSSSPGPALAGASTARSTSWWCRRHFPSAVADQLAEEAVAHVAAFA